MKCPRCGYNNRDVRARFCHKCRALLPGMADVTQERPNIPRQHRRVARRTVQSPWEALLHWKGWITVCSAVLVLIVVAVIIGASDRKSSTPNTKAAEAIETTTPVAQPLLLSDETLTLELGESYTLQITGAGEENLIQWKSSDESIAAVDEDGKITLLSAGEAVITADDPVSGTHAECVVQGVKPAVLEGFTPPEEHKVGKGYQLEGVITAASAIEQVKITVYDSDNDKELEGSVEWEADGPLVYDFNDEEKNINKLVGFKKLTLGDKRLVITVATKSHEEIKLGSWDFEVYKPKFPYKSALDPEAYPTLMPDEWSYWVKAENCNANIDPVFMGRLAALAKAHNKKLIFYSGFRTYDKQKELYNMYLKGTGNLAAKPGSGWHEFGAAVDAKDWVRELGAKEMAKYGLCKPVSGESWHIQPIETKNGLNKKSFYNTYSSSKYPKWSKNCYITK